VSGWRCKASIGALRFEEKSGAALSLVNPILKNASQRDLCKVAPCW